MLIKRADIWSVDLEPTRGHEQAGKNRPCVVISVDQFNNSPAEMVFVLPLTRTNKTNIPFRVKVEPPEVREVSYIKCDDLRSLSTERLQKCLGSVSKKTITEVERILKLLLGIY